MHCIAVDRKLEKIPLLVPNISLTLVFVVLLFSAPKLSLPRKSWHFCWQEKWETFLVNVSVLNIHKIAVVMAEGTALAAERRESWPADVLAMVRCAVHWPQQTCLHFTPTDSPRVFFLAFFFREHFSWCFSFSQVSFLGQTLQHNTFSKLKFLYVKVLSVVQLSQLVNPVSHRVKAVQTFCLLFIY